MSLATILAGIEATAVEEIACLQAETATRTRQILAEADQAAAARASVAQREAARPAAGERARVLHRAKLEALRATGDVRDKLVETALDETRRRLAQLRLDPEYPLILRRLTEEAIRVLGDEIGEDGHTDAWLEIDPRDEALLRRIVHDLGLSLPIRASLKCAGGLVAQSGDGKIIAINTLEARLERATPYLRHALAVFLVEQCLISTTSMPASAP